MRHAKNAYHPIETLDHEDEVEFILAGTGEIVPGRMIRGIVSPASRSYFSLSTGRPELCLPAQWRPRMSTAAPSRHRSRKAVAA